MRIGTFLYIQEVYKVPHVSVDHKLQGNHACWKLKSKHSQNPASCASQDANVGITLESHGSCAIPRVALRLQSVEERVQSRRVEELRSMCPWRCDCLPFHLLLLCDVSFKGITHSGFIFPMMQ